MSKAFDKVDYAALINKVVDPPSLIWRQGNFLDVIGMLLAHLCGQWFAYFPLCYMGGLLLISFVALTSQENLLIGPSVIYKIVDSG